MTGATNNHASANEHRAQAKVPAIEVRGVSKTFGALKQAGKPVSNSTLSSKPLFVDVQFSLQPGESLVVMGPSGSGKSTLLKILGGLDRPDQVHDSELSALGRSSARPLISIHGQSWLETIGPSLKRLRSMVGFAFQRGALFDSMTSLANLTFVLERVSGYSAPDAVSRGRELLEQVGLGHAGQLFPAELSGGMQKRLSVARALATDPQVVFYDDPIAGLDPITSRSILDLLRKLQNDKGNTVVCTLNDVTRAIQFADFLGFLLGGAWHGPFAVAELKAALNSRPNSALLPNPVLTFLRGEPANES